MTKSATKIAELTPIKLREVVFQRLQQLIASPGIGTQKALAEKSNVSRSTINKAMQKHETLSVKNALQIAKNCGVTLDYIYGLSEYPYLEQSVVELLEQHISAQTSKKTFPFSDSPNVYSIPTVRMSESFKEYLDTIRNADKLNDKDAQDAARKAAREILINATDTEDKEEYVLIPYSKLNDSHLLDILGIMPDSQI